MAIPDYQSLMLPLLQLASDQEEHTIAETVGSLAKEFKLTEQEQEELLTSGSETVFTNRVRWARTFLKKAALIDATGRGRFRISQRGLEVLKDTPQRIDADMLAAMLDDPAVRRLAARSLEKTSAVAPRHPSSNETNWSAPNPRPRLRAR